jgi:hypothetical protein
MPSYRIARNCIDAEAMITTRCTCCNGIKLLLIDNQDRIRAVVSVSIEELRDTLARAQAGELPPYDVRPVSGGRLHS